MGTRTAALIPPSIDRSTKYVTARLDGIFPIDVDQGTSDYVLGQILGLHLAARLAFEVPDKRRPHLGYQPCRHRIFD